MEKINDINTIVSMNYDGNTLDVNAFDDDSSIYVQLNNDELYKLLLSQPSSKMSLENRLKKDFHVKNARHTRRARRRSRRGKHTRHTHPRQNIRKTRKGPSVQCKSNHHKQKKRKTRKHIRSIERTIY
jgi:hypothetical protein